MSELARISACTTNPCLNQYRPCADATGHAGHDWKYPAGMLSAPSKKFHCPGAGYDYVMGRRE